MALIDNIVAYWKLDEASGDAADATGNGHTGVNTSITYSTTGAVINNAGQFNGSSGVLTVANNAALNLESIDNSISFWTRPTNVTTAGYLMWKGSYGASLSQWYVRISTAGKLQIGYSYNSDASYDYYPCNTALSINTLYHIRITRNATTRVIKVYINNVEDGVTTLTAGAAVTTADTLALLFGCQAPSGSNIGFYAGSLDEIGIWSRVLSDAEGTSLYNGGAGFQYPFSATSIKTINGLALASVKSVNGLAIASVKTQNGLA